MPEGRTLKGERIAHVKGVAFSGEDDGRTFNLDITSTDCTDSMSGEAVEFTATWDYAGQRMHGCARSSHCSPHVPRHPCRGWQRASGARADSSTPFGAAPSTHPSSPQSPTTTRP